MEVEASPVHRIIRKYEMSRRILFLLFVSVTTLVGLVLTEQTDNELPSPGTGKKILILPPLVLVGMGGSPMILLETIAVILAEEGYDVTILGPEKFKYQTDVNNPTKYISTGLTDGLKLMETEETKVLASEGVKSGFLFKLIYNVLQKDADICDDFFSRSELLSQLKEENFDFVLAVPLPGFCNLLISDKLDIPFGVVTLSTDFVGETHFFNRVLYIPNPYAMFAHPMLNVYGRGMTFKERVLNVLMHLATRYIISERIIFSRYDEIKARHAINPDESLYELVSKTQMLFFSSFLGLSPAKPLPPNVHYIGGIQGQVPVKPLPEDMEQFIASAGKEGVVYMALGSFMSKIIDEDLSEIIINAASGLDRKVMLSWKGWLPEKIGSNVKIWKWMPQNDILAHPNVTVFINHCGLNSMLDTIHHGKPLVCLNGWGDSFVNSAICKQVGFCENLHLSTVTPEALSEVVHRVNDNPDYRQNVRKISQMMRDRPLGPKENLKFWIGHWFRNNGTEFTKVTAHHDLNFFQYFLIDVFAFLTLVIIIVLSVLYIMLRFIVKALWGKFKKTKKD